MRSNPTHCAECPIRAKALFQVVAENYLQDAESRRMGQFELAARANLYQEQSLAGTAYTLYEGWLLLYRTHSDGSRQGLRVALPGDFVGYMPQADGVYSHGAMAITPVIVCGFRQADLHAMIHNHSDIARQITAIQAKYLEICEASILGLGRKSAEQRIAFTVADLYHRLERRGDTEVGECRGMPFPLTQEMLGELTGLTPVHTNRVLRKMRSDGVMVAERQWLAILDMPRLMEIGEYRPAEVC